MLSQMDAILGIIWMPHYLDHLNTKLIWYPTVFCSLHVTFYFMYRQKPNNAEK